MKLPVLEGERLTLRPLAGEEDVERLAAIVRSPSVARWWTESGDPARLRESLLNEGRAFVVEAGGEVAGWLGFDEETDPDYRHASIDISLAPEHQDQGLGSEAIRLAIRWLAGERGHHRVTIDPRASNARAIRAYERVGFRPVGVLRRYERQPDGSWEDALLMDLLVEELRTAGGSG